MKNTQYGVGREIHFSYGHRILNHSGKCKRLHGHNGKAMIEMAAPELDKLGMVVDFYKIRETIGKWIDETLDHRMILWEKDPMAEILKKAGEPIIVVGENPTAEFLAKWIYDKAVEMQLPVERVSLWESDNSFAVYGKA